MINPMSLEGRNIVITGAGQGIGEAAARMVVDLGGYAILTDIQETSDGDTWTIQKGKIIITEEQTDAS